MVSLLIGPKHAGKTTAAAELIRRVRARGRTVAGILAPSIWVDGVLHGFDIVDIATGRRTRLSDIQSAGEQTSGRFRFCAEGLALGQAALSDPAARIADLVIVDEFGPLELRGGGWRDAVDALVGHAAGLLVLVVRQSLAESVAGLYRASIFDAQGDDRQVVDGPGMLRSIDQQIVDLENMLIGGEGSQASKPVGLA